MLRVTAHGLYQLNYNPFPSLMILSGGVLLPVFFAYLFGISAASCFYFVGYVFIYHFLNGLLIFSLLKQEWSDIIKLPSILVAGICYNILTLYILSFMHLQVYAFFNPVPLILMSLIFRFKFINLHVVAKENLLKNILVLTLLAIPFFLGAAEYTLSNPVNHHFTFQGAIAASVAHTQYPYVNFLFPEAPLYYNYGYHLELGFASLLLPVNLEDLASRIYPLYMFFLLIWTSYAFCEKFIKGGAFSAIIFSFFAFGVVGFYPPSSAFHPMIGVSSSCILAGSSMLAITIFFISLYKIINDNFSSTLDYVFIFFLIVSGIISRSVFPFILGGCLVFPWIGQLLKVRNFDSLKCVILKNKNFIVISFFVFFALILSLVFVYGALTPYSALGFITIFTQNFQFIGGDGIKKLVTAVLPSLPKGGSSYNVIVAFISIILSPGYLIPGFYYQVLKWFKNRPSDAELILIYGAFTGCVIWNFTHAPGASHYTFYHYFYLVVNMIGAAGTYHLIRNVLKIISTLNVILIFLVFAGLALKIYEIYYIFTNTPSFRSLSFREPPEYALPKSNIDFLRNLSTKNNDIIIVPIFTEGKYKYAFISEVIAISTNQKNAYHTASIDYGLSGLLKKSYAIHNRASLVSQALLKAAENSNLSNKDIENLIQIFPKKSICFIFNKDRKVESDLLELINELDDNKFMLYKADSHLSDISQVQHVNSLNSK